MEDIMLVIPAKEHENQAREYIREFQEYHSHINGVGGLSRYEDYDAWLAKLAADMDYDHIQEGKVPANTYFLVRKIDGRILGMMNVRHKLNDFLLREGGHIGYSIRPTERRKGYATNLLKLGLDRCRELGIDRVLVCCDKQNIGSARTIQKNGGILENEIADSSLADVLQRYWIEL